MTLPERSREPELMDDPAADPRELERSLGALRGVNRWLGGTRMMLGLLRPELSRIADRPVRILDVGTGSADIPLALAGWGRRHGVELRVTATDLHATTLAAARAQTAGTPEVEVLPADALDLPFSDEAFHLAICSTALHHFDAPEASRVLREMARVASHAVIVTDLLRSVPALVGVRLLAATVWRTQPITRHDGPASVRAAFTARELERLARAAGLEGARVRSHPVLMRVSLVYTGPGADR